MANIIHPDCCKSRRDFLRTGLFGIGVGAAMPLVFGHSSLAMAAESFFGGAQSHPERILIVVELSGGNDGLNTLVPHRNDEYFKARPTLAVKNALKLNDEFGLHPSLGGLQKIWDQGRLAIVPGCGYPNPNLSHFESMDYWHTASPHAPESLGWVGRLADAASPQHKSNFIINVAQKQALAVRSAVHSPVTFSDPDKFVRVGDPSQAPVYAKLIDKSSDGGNAALSFLQDTARNAAESSVRVRAAIAKYKTPVDYGVESGKASLASDLKKVAALISAGFPTRFFYVNLGGFDTHAGQVGAHRALLYYVGDALRGLMEDLERIGRAGDVAVMMFTEFGRRVSENASGGTDHGAASPMWMIGKKVKGGIHGKYPSLTDLDADGNMKMTMDFRRVYATMIKEWMGYGDTRALLKGDFAPLPVFS